MTNIATKLYNQITLICSSSSSSPYDKENDIRVLIDSNPYTKITSSCGRSTTYTFNDSSALEELYDEDFGGSLSYRTSDPECNWVGIEFNYYFDDSDFMTPEEEEEYLRYREEGWSN